MSKYSELKKTSKTLKEATTRIKLLRSAFAVGCKILGISQDTCLSLTLMLFEEDELETMLWAMAKAEEEGIKLNTTQVVLIAEKIKEKSEYKCIG